MRNSRRNWRRSGAQARPELLGRAHEAEDVFTAEDANGVIGNHNGKLADGVTVHHLERRPQLGIRARRPHSRSRDHGPCGAGGAPLNPWNLDDVVKGQ